MTLPPINLSNLDYDSIYANIKTYIKSKSEFTDFDFDGSALSTLLDLLTFNTYYQLVFQNILVNEMFIDSAQKIESLRSHAKLHGYTIQNRYSSVSNITLSSVSSFSINDYESFTGIRSNGTSKSFYALPGVEVVNDGTNFTSTFDLYEAQTGVVNQSFSFNTDRNACFIPTQNIDFRTITVKANGETYRRGGTTEPNSTTENIYYLESNGTGYDVRFTKTFESSPSVTISYLVPSGDSGNGINQFSISRRNPPVLTYTVNESSSGGSELSSLSDLKFLIPRTFASQERAITESDIKSSLYEAGFAPNGADDITLTTSATPGQVFVSIGNLSGTEPEVVTFLQNRGVIGIDYNYGTAS